MHDPDVTNYEKLATDILLIGQNLVLFFSMFLVKKVKVGDRESWNILLIGSPLLWGRSLLLISWDIPIEIDVLWFDIKYESFSVEYFPYEVLYYR